MSISRDTTYNVVGAVVPVVLALLTVPLYLRLVGPDRFGVLSIAWLLLGYFGLFDLGLGRATSFRIAALRDARPETRADTFWAALSVNVGMGLIGGAILWVAGDLFFGHVFKVDERLRPEILAGVPLLAAAVPVATLTGVLTGALQGRERFLQMNLVSVLSTTLFQVFPLLIAWRLGPGLPRLLLGALAARLVAVLVLSRWCHAEITRGQPRRIEGSEVRILLKYGAWVSLTSVFGPMLVIVDRFVIGAVLGAVAVAVYTVPFQLAQRIAILPTALISALFPRIAAASADEQRALGEKSTLALASLLSFPVLVALFLLAPFLHLWVGDRMAAAGASVGRILLIGFWANAFALVPYAKLQGSGRPDLVTKMLLIQIPPYLFGLYVAMTYAGLVGAALVFSARCVTDYILLTLAARSKFRTLPVLALNFTLLVLAAYVSARWSMVDWRWWVSATVLGAASLALGWRTLAPDVREQLVKRLGSLARGGAYG